MESNYLTEIQKAPFLFLNDHPWDYFKPISNTLDNSKDGNICSEEIFYNTFISELNIQYINLMIKKTIYNNTCDKYIVRDQKREHLEQIMKGLYHDYAQHFSFDQKKQFGIINKIVIDYCVKTILTELESRFKYMRDKFSPLETLPSPINTSTAGSKSFLPSITNIYNPDLNIINKSDKEESDDIFSKKVISNSSNLPTQQKIDFQQYYFADDKTNMFAKEKKLTTVPPKIIFNNNPNYPDNSLPVHGYSSYTSTPAPAPINYYVPVTDNTRSRPY